MKDTATKWAERIASGKVAACRPVVWAAERHLADLRRKDLEWRPESAEKILNFFRSYLCHYKGPMAGQTIDPEPWQEFGLGSMFGWYLPDGRRRFREAYWEIPRGNGKTTLAAGVPLFGMLRDGEPAPECYVSATKEEQAKICWRDAVAFTKNSPVLNELLRPKMKEIVCETTNGFLKPLGSDSLTLDGLNPHIVVADEIHAWKSGELYRVLTTAMIKRDRALMFSITTAGFNSRGFGAQIHTNGMKVLAPDATEFCNDRFFYYIFQMDDPAKWRTKKQWYLANPMLGVSLKESDMVEAVATCNQPPNTEREFRVKRLNDWESEKEGIWLPMKAWNRCGGEIPADAFKGRRGFAGLDLAEVTDLSALVVVYPPEDDDDEMLVRCMFWCPSEGIRSRSVKDGVPYDKWVESGHLRTIPGEVMDFHFIERDIVELADEWNFSALGIDPWKGKDLAQRLGDEHDMDVVEVRQGFTTLSPLCNEIKRLVMGELVRHGDNPILNWMAENIVVRLDPAGNVKFDKAKSRERIDGMVALAMAIGVAGEDDGPSVYGGRGTTAESASLFL
jgi:phage terminase large subunit-like protein